VTILETTSGQFDRASALVTRRHAKKSNPAALNKETEQMVMLAGRWSGSAEWAEWRELFERIGISEPVAASIFSAGVEVGYELRVAQESDQGSN
jgi:hypothetical protein